MKWERATDIKGFSGDREEVIMGEDVEIGYNGQGTNPDNIIVNKLSEQIVDNGPGKIE